MKKSLSRRNFIRSGAIMGSLVIIPDGFTKLSRNDEHINLADMSDSQTSLENIYVQLEIKDGKIVSLLDKKRNFQHISSDASTVADLFEIELVKGIVIDSVIKASEMESRVIRKKSSLLEIEFTHSKVHAVIAIEIDPNTGESRWKIHAKPLDKHLAVGSVAYPIIDTPQSEDGKVKQCLLPFYEGFLSPLTMPPKQGFAYPRVLFAQLIACIGKKAGFMLWTDDQKVNVKEFAYANIKTEKALFRVTHRFPYVADKMWKQSYQTLLSLTGPSWYDAADIYRDWVTSVPMIGKKLRDRKSDATASIVHMAPISINSSLPVDAAEVNSIPGKVKALQEQVDARFVLRGTQWEKQWPWHSGPDFFPPAMGETAFRHLAKELNGLDVTLIDDVHGLIWAAGNHPFLRNFKKTTEEQIERIAKDLEQYFVEHEGEKLCITNLNGSLNKKGGLRYDICRGTEFGKTYLPQIADKLFELGATGFHSDLDIGPLPDGVDGCFNQDHGHPIPCGTWSYEAARQNFIDIRASAAERNIRPFLLTKEHCTESLIPVLDAYLARHSLVIEDPQVCLLAQYLFHEYIPTMLYGASSVQRLAALVIYGQLPGIGLKPPDDPAYISILQDYCHAMKGKGKDFLLYGKMKRLTIEGIPPIQVKMAMKGYVDFTNPNQNMETPTMEIPSVLNSAWEDGEGNIGVYVVNIGDDAITLQLPAQGTGACDVIFNEGTPSAKQQKTKPGDVLEWQVPPNKLCSAIFSRIK